MQMKSMQIISAEAETNKQTNITGHDTIKSEQEEEKNAAAIFDEVINFKKIEEQASSREVELMLEKAKIEEGFYHAGLSTEMDVQDAYSDYEKYKDYYEKEYGSK